MRRRNFTFTITDTAIFLGKSPVTLRQWERKGFARFPRLGTDRRLTIDDIRSISLTAYLDDRIPKERYLQLQSILNQLEIIEGVTE